MRDAEQAMDAILDFLAQRGGSHHADIDLKRVEPGDSVGLQAGVGVALKEDSDIQPGGIGSVRRVRRGGVDIDGRVNVLAEGNTELAVVARRNERFEVRRHPADRVGDRRIGEVAQLRAEGGNLGPVGVITVGAGEVLSFSE
jgi:hypothetical protein